MKILIKTAFLFSMLFIWGELHGAELQKKSPTSFVSCNIVLNEIYIGNPLLEFVEISKKCPAGKSVQVNKLTGFFLLGLTLGDSHNLTLSQDLSDQSLTKGQANFENIVIGGELVSTKNLGFDELGYEAQSDDQVLGSDYRNTYVVILLHLAQRTTRLQHKKQLLKLAASGKSGISKIVTSEIAAVIRDHLQDAIVYGASCEDTYSCEILRDIHGYVQPSSTFTLNYPLETVGKTSFSRDVAGETPFSPKLFKHCKPSPGKENQCLATDDFCLIGMDNSMPDMVYPFTFRRNWLQHQTRHAILNGLAFFKYAETHPEVMSGTPAQLTSKVVNVNILTVSKTSKMNSQGLSLATPQIRNRKCPKIESIDNFDKDLIRRIVMNFYKENRPPFLKDIYFKFLNDVREKSCKTNPVVSSVSGTGVIADSTNLNAELPTPFMSTLTEEQWKRMMPNGATRSDYVLPVNNQPVQPNQSPSHTTKGSRPEAHFHVHTTQRPVSCQENSAATGCVIPTAIVDDVEIETEGCNSNKLFYISLDTFRKLLKMMGFVYGRVNCRMALVQRPDIVQLRGKYLRALKKNAELTTPLPIIYFDETWFDANARLLKAWLPKVITGSKMFTDYAYKKNKVGRAPRLIVIGAASTKTGVIKELLKIYKIKKTDVEGDYHQNINSDVFLKWIGELIVYLADKGPHIIVMDNASYHSKSTLPKLSDIKQVLYDWLVKEKENDATIELKPMKTMLKTELWDLIKSRKSRADMYEVDNALKKHGHHVLRLPPYNCDLNPVELLWNDAKRQIKLTNTQQDINLVKATAETVLKNYPLTTWLETVKHVNRRATMYWNDDHHSENIRSDLKIHIVSDEDEEEEDTQGDDARVLHTFPGYCGIPDFNDMAWLRSLDPNADVDDVSIEDDLAACGTHEEATGTPKIRAATGVKRKLNMV